MSGWFDFYVNQRFSFERGFWGAFIGYDATLLLTWSIQPSVSICRLYSPWVMSIDNHTTSSLRTNIKLGVHEDKHSHAKVVAWKRTEHKSTWSVVKAKKLLASKPSSICMVWYIQSHKIIFLWESLRNYHEPWMHFCMWRSARRPKQSYRHPLMYSQNWCLWAGNLNGNCGHSLVSNFFWNTCAERSEQSYRHTLDKQNACIWTGNKSDNSH